MLNARILAESPADRVHGNYIFGIIVIYGGKVAELSFDGVF